MAGSMRSDLARECGCEENTQGVRVLRSEACGHEILRVQIKTEEAANPEIKIEQKEALSEEEESF